MEKRLLYPELYIDYLFSKGLECGAKIRFKAEVPLSACREFENEKDWMNILRFLLSMPTYQTVKKVIYHNPATIVYWNDGTKTVVKCDDRDTYSKEAGLALCYMKKMLGSSRAFNDVLKEWTE